MPSPTYTPLANITLGSAQSSVSFSSISGSFRDLVLIMDGSSSAGGFASLRFNGDTGSNYNYLFMYGSGGGSGTSQAFSNQTLGFIGNIDAGSLNTTLTQIMDYSATDKHKTYLSRNRAGGLVIATAGRWANTNAITSMTVNISTGNFSAGHSFALYGIAS